MNPTMVAIANVTKSHQERRFWFISISLFVSEETITSDCERRLAPNKRPICVRDMILLEVPV